MVRTQTFIHLQHLEVHRAPEISIFKSKCFRRAQIKVALMIGSQSSVRTRKATKTI